MVRYVLPELAQIHQVVMTQSAFRQH